MPRLGGALGRAWLPLSVILLASVVLAALLRPGPDILTRLGSSQAITDRHGELLRMTLSPDDKYRLRAELADFPPQLIEAVLLHEDRFFFRHAGVNPIALFKAAWETYVRRDRRVGASTITMQLARLAYGIDSTTIAGKLRQMARAGLLELLYTKAAILETYLNLAPFGGNIEGYPAAAFLYFGKDVGDLLLPEMLALVVVPQSPARRDPLRKPDAVALARSQLYMRWLRTHPDDSRFAGDMNLPFSVTLHLEFTAPHFVESLLQQHPPDVTIRTTIDGDKQALLERIVGRYLDRKGSLGVHNAAALLVDSRNAEILAALGSADYHDRGISGQVNGTRSPRSPGSTLKPFIYGLAIDQGLIHPFSMLKDAPTSFGAYTPDNYRSDFKGPVTAENALVHSRNVPAVALAAEIRDPDLWELLSVAGIGGLKSRSHYGLSIVLGSAELTMEELVALYVALATDGKLRPLRRTLSDSPAAAELQGSRLVSPQAAFILREMLRTNPRPDERPFAGRDPGRPPVAFKTGTSIGFRDSWSVSLFDRYVLAVWIGNFDGSGNPAFIGRYLATPLMFEIIDALMEEQGGISVPADTPPPGIELVAVCSVSGRLPNGHCPHTELTWFIPGLSPIGRCDIHREIHVDLATGYRVAEGSGPDVVSEVREFWPSDMLALFREAGLPRRLPPPFSPLLSEERNRRLGSAPTITSPLERTAYVLRPGVDRHGDVPLRAVADGDVGELYWFVNESFIGRAQPDEVVFWDLHPGRHVVRVIDDAGRSDQREIDVVLAP